MSRSDTADRRFRVFCDQCDWRADATHPNSLVARAEAERHDDRVHDGEETADVEVVIDSAEPEIVTDGGTTEFGVADMLPNSPLSDDEIDEWEGLISPVAAPADTDGWTQAIFLNPTQQTYHGLDWDVEAERWHCFYGPELFEVRDALARRRVSHDWYEAKDDVDRGRGIETDGGLGTVDETPSDGTVEIEDALIYTRKERSFTVHAVNEKSEGVVCKLAQKGYPEDYIFREDVDDFPKDIHFCRNCRQYIESGDLRPMQVLRNRVRELCGLERAENSQRFDKAELNAIIDSLGGETDE